jgi:hypothetical protein
MASTTEADLFAELKYEFDSLYVGAEIVQSPNYKQHPVDGLLYEACLLHFRVVWDFFYGGGKKSDFTVREFLSNDALKRNRPKQPKRLAEIREYLDVMLAHLSRERIDPKRKTGEPHMVDFALIRKHTEDLFKGFVAELRPEQRKMLVNPLAHKFSKFKTLEP